MDVLRELVDENALLLIRVAGKSEYVLLGHRAQGIGFAAAESAGARIPEIFCRQTRKIAQPPFGHADEFRQVAGEFIMGHYAHARATLDHRSAHVRSLRQHHVHKECGFLKRVRVHFRRSDNGEPLRTDALGIKGRNAVPYLGGPRATSGGPKTQPHPRTSEIGVGMAVAGHPSLRTGLADFPHPALQSVSHPLVAGLVRLARAKAYREISPSFSKNALG